MSFEDAGCYGGFTNPRDFGIITFGGANAQDNHYFVANGNADSVTSNTESIGSRFIAGVPMRLFRLTSHRSANAPANAEIFILKNGQASHLSVGGNFYSQDLGSNFTLSIGDVLQLRALVSNWFPAPGTTLISLYFYPLSEQTPLYSEPDSALVNIMTFAGANANRNTDFLRFNGNLNQVVNNNANDAGNYCVVGAPMVVDRITWQKSTLGASTMLLRGTSAELRAFDLNGPMGTMVPQTIMFNVGDVIRVQPSSINVFPGTCTVSLYARKL